MTTISRTRFSFIECSFLMKFSKLNSSSNLIVMEQILHQLRCCKNITNNIIQKGLYLDMFILCKIWAIVEHLETHFWIHYVYF